jgi:SAM-dependent methyltransferase
MTEAVQTQGAYWNDQTATHWAAMQDRTDAIFAPLTRIGIAAAAPRPAERALDIGCGCGATLLALAEQVGPPGDVLGVDISRPMSLRAEQRLAAAGVTNAKLLVADAGTYPFEPAGYDLLFSRLGVMFFPEPVAALSNLRRATRPGGRIAWIVWRAVVENPFHAVPLQAALPLLPPAPAADPFAPGPLAFADADRVRFLLNASGWRHAELTRHDVPLCLAAGNDIAAAAEAATWMGPLARRLAAQGHAPELDAAVRRAVAEALRPYICPDGVLLTGSIWLISAEA